MRPYLITKCIKINCFLLNFELIDNYNQSIINFIINLETKTKLQVIAGSFSFILIYNFLFIFNKKYKILIISNIPLINKIFNFYRKIILLKYYDN